MKFDVDIACTWYIICIHIPTNKLNKYKLISIIPYERQFFALDNKITNDLNLFYHFKFYRYNYNKIHHYSWFKKNILFSMSGKINGKRSWV